MIQWFEPPIDIARVMAGGVGGIAPDLWGMELRFILERVRRSEVARAVMGLVRRRTTLYPSDVHQTEPDPYPDNPLHHEPGPSREELRILARTTGTSALIWFNSSARVVRSSGVGASTPDASLVHELVHAVNITWGTFRDRPFDSAETQRRAALSGEEELAWVIDNMYRSEMRMWLRGQYLGEKLQPPNSRSLPSDHFAVRAVARCNSNLRQLAARLEHLDGQTCPYNPFREYAALAPHERPW